jgi:hypothetical protein
MSEHRSEAESLSVLDRRRATISDMAKPYEHRSEAESLSVLDRRRATISDMAQP